MDKFKRILILGLIIVFAVISFGCGSKKNTEEIKVNKIPVEVADVCQKNFSKIVVLSGLTEPKAQVQIFPKVLSPEKINDIKVKVGDRVNAGETIALLDQSTVAIQLNSAQISYDDAQKNYERNKALWEMGAISDSVLEQAEIRVNTTRNSLEAQQIAFNNTIIKSPISGIVTSVTAEEGNLASAQTPIAIIMDLDVVNIKTSINEKQINKVVNGDKVEVLIPAADNKICEGKIISVSPAMDQLSKAYPIEIEVDNPQNIIKTGMYAEIELVTDLHPEAIIVPAEAVITRDDISKVFTVIEDKAVMREVTVGLTNGKETEILQGLQKGEKVITRGNEDVVDGDFVIVVNRGEN